MRLSVLEVITIKEALLQGLTEEQLEAASGGCGIVTSPEAFFKECGEKVKRYADRRAKMALFMEIAMRKQALMRYRDVMGRKTADVFK